MTFDSREHITGLLQVALASVAPEHTDTPIHLERPKQASHGDFATNLPMQLARALKQAPRAIAERIVSALPTSPLVSEVSIAGAGFINFTLQADAKTRVVSTVLAQASDFGRSTLGQNAKVLVEFVSANPTGPLHVGHGRGAAYGASLSDLLAFAGWDVTREYYVNDAGRQMDILAISTWIRYLDQHGVSIDYPPNGYQGDYVREMARQLTNAHGDKYVRSKVVVLEGTPGLPDASRADDEAKTQRELHLDALIANGKKLLAEDWPYVHQHALSEQLADGRDDLDGFGVDFQNWFSENSLFDTGLVARCLDKLDAAGHVYEQNGARWFRSTDFGDEKDRVVQRENGLYTYFASDIAYHLNKYERGFDRMINIWGADHHGYIPRVKGAVQALAAFSQLALKRVGELQCIKAQHGAGQQDIDEGKATQDPRVLQKAGHQGAAEASKNTGDAVGDRHAQHIKQGKQKATRMRNRVCCIVPAENDGHNDGHHRQHARGEGKANTGTKENQQIEPEHAFVERAGNFTDAISGLCRLGGKIRGGHLVCRRSRCR